MSRKKKGANRLRRAERLKRQLNVSAPKGRLDHDSPAGETFQVPAALLEKLGLGDGAGESDRKKERRKLGAYNTPMALAEEVVAKALYPHLLWMAEDPEGWDKAHQRPAPPPVMGPHQYAHQYPLKCGCYVHRKKRSCPVHAAELESRDRADAARAKERKAILRDSPGNAGLLLTALEAAVPLWIEELRGMDADDRVELGHSLAQIVAEKGDILMYGSKKKDGKVAEVFNATAKGLAALAFQPGGVTWCGIHWEATS